MDITRTTLREIENFDRFSAVYTEFVSETLWRIRLMPEISPSRMQEAYEAWMDDKNRVDKNEENLQGLSHFKQCGHLAFWLRRMAPITETHDMTGALTYTPEPFTKEETLFQKLMLSYCNEYLAFDFGFQIVKFYELGKTGRAEALKLSSRYYEIACYFMKRKHVSPHAMTIIYKSLFTE